MSRKKHTPEQVINKLREAEVAIAEGGTVAEAARRIGVTEQTFYRWRSYFDDPIDQAGIRIGINLYDQHGLNIDEVKFRQVFQGEAGNLRTSQEDQYRIP